MKAVIIYWSGTGNTESIANFIAEGVKDAKADVEVKSVSSATIDDVKNADIIAFGCPSMGDEVLEESEFQPFMESIMEYVKGKKIALFGSYGWGDGRWMQEWSDCMTGAGSILIDKGLIVNGSPTDADAEICKELGKKLATA